MFYATAKALRNAADARLDDGDRFLLDDGIVASEPISVEAATIDAEIDADRAELRRLHEEYRWAESKLLNASERLEEAREARRKDLVALACMRRELKASYSCERRYAQMQLHLFGEARPSLWVREIELANLIADGAVTSAAVRELAAVRAERKLLDIAIVQAEEHLSRIDASELTLDYDIANEAFDRSIDGKSLRELARLRNEKTRAERAGARARSEARRLLEELDLMELGGEITMAAALLSLELEGDSRSALRIERLRAEQMERELSILPKPANWKAGLLHPVSWWKAKRITS
jgi:hypothetical protein